MIARLVLLVLLVRGAIPDPVSFKMGYSYGAPASITIILRIPKHADNRGVCLGYVPTGDTGIERMTCWALEADRAPILTQITFTDVPGGEYEMGARLCREYWDSSTNECRRWVQGRSHTFIVIGRDMPVKGRK